MSEIEIEKKNVVYLVAERSDLNRFSKEGWRLEKILQEDRVEACSDYIPVANNNGFIENRTATKYLPVSRPLFLMSFDENSFVAMVQADLVTAKKELIQMTGEYEKTTKLLVEEQQKLAYSEQLYKDSETRRLEYYDKLKAENDRNAKLEADIAKIRAAIGERQMRDILAEAK